MNGDRGHGLPGFPSQRYKALRVNPGYEGTMPRRQGGKREPLDVCECKVVKRDVCVEGLSLGSPLPLGWRKTGASSGGRRSQAVISVPIFKNRMWCHM